MHNWASGLIPQNSSTPEAITTTLSFSRSDKPVYTTVSIRPISHCQPTQTLAGPVFSHSAIHGRLYAPLGCPYGGLPDFRYLDPFRPQTPYQRFGTQSLIFGLPSLGHSAMKAMDNTTVVSYIHKQGGNEQGETHSFTLFPPVVDQVLWLQTQGITIRTRHISGCLNVIADYLFWSNRPMATEWSLHPEILNRIFRTGGTPTVDMFATVYNTHLPQFMSLIQDPRALAIDALSQDW